MGAGILTHEDRVLTCGGFDAAIRWHPGERLDGLFEAVCDGPHGDRTAVHAGPLELTYRRLDERANRLGRFLLAHGVLPGDRLGLLPGDAIEAYVGMLAVLKINAAYVPLDAAFPDDRLAFIAKDAGIRLVLTSSSLRTRFEQGGVDLVYVDEEAARIEALPGDRITPAEKGEPDGELCYVVYTSGSTGRPKGVPIEHAAICNFVRVAAEVYGLTAEDRVYQGMTIAFDFSVEEIWVPLMCGATLVPKPAGGVLVGPELHEFLHTHDITALCCVPTLLSTLDDLPDLRFLLVSGEACPAETIKRWHRPGRRFLNVYGPTEATVTATWAVAEPDRPVTIGVPLPTYSVVILDPGRARALPPGELGEIGIAGVGLATGYLRRPDLTERAFVPDFLGLGHNPSGRIYRTGDLGKITPDGEIEYHGRADTQVKIRGYRVELTEIESALLQVPGVTQAVVEPTSPARGRTELVAYYSVRRGFTAGTEQLRTHLRERLPAYMVPTSFVPLDRIPTTPAGKADRRNLPVPAPTGPAGHVAPATGAERVLAQALADVLGLEKVSATAHFFDDHGADSLLLAQFCARVRDLTGLAPPSMREVYRHPTVCDLAAALPVQPLPAQPGTAAEPYRASTAGHVLCGVAQAMTFLAYAMFAGLVIDLVYTWILAAQSVLDGYIRAVAAGCGGFVVMAAIPILLKWLLIGRWRTGGVPVWSPGYLRFWAVKATMRLNPLSLFAGSPIYAWYLRALGAKIGKGAVILSRNPPVCTDLLTIGEGTVIRKDSFFSCYRISSGYVQPGRVTLGRNAFVGEMSVLDVDTTLGDDAQLGHGSCLRSGQSVPAGESWHGSPACHSTIDYRVLPAGMVHPLRRFAFALSQLLVLILVTLPAVLVGAYVVFRYFSSALPDFTGWMFYGEEAAGSAVLYFGALASGLAIVLLLPRVLSLFLRPGRTYPLYGLCHALHRAIARLTNIRAFTYLFGDSSYIVHYLRALGYRMPGLRQTGSNFGVEVKHETPFLATVGSGTMVSDGLSLLNAEFSASSFRLRRTAVAAQAFLGNNIAYPPDAHVGRNCLLATKVLVPLDGPVRADVGLLGSPAFEIPRSVRRDTELVRTGDARRLGLAGKNRHNLATMGWYLLTQWLHLAGLLLVDLAAVALYPRFGALVPGAAIVAMLVFSASFLVLAEHAAQGFRALRPRFCSIYDPVFWRHERFWKHSSGRYLAVFDGTPMKAFLWRLLGVRIGRRVLDDGCTFPERSLVTVGDDCVLNAGSVIQCHSLEDGTFKSDRTALGSGCTVGVGAFVHYGVSMDRGTVVEADTFLMKGTRTPPFSRWHGNPATETLALRSLK